jgi:restriction endonuclease S subunit/type I restriction-modification system DNA methylase subunit
MNTTYECLICKTKPEQKSYNKTHLKSDKHKKKTEVFKLKLEKKTNNELIKEYRTLDIDKIIKKRSKYKVERLIKNIDEKEYKLIKQLRSGKIYFELSKEDKQSKNEERQFKNEFKNKLKKWHNILSGAGITGDSALDDIINILVICYLENKISKTGKFDLLNLKKYPTDIIYDNEDLNDFLKYFNIKYLLNDTSILTKSKDDNIIPSLTKIGIILSNHPLTNKIYINENIINCNKHLILSKLILEIYEYSQEKNIFYYQDLIGIACEYMLNEYKGNSGKDLGNYFTERDLMLMSFHLLDNNDIKKYINNNSIIGDEFCGTFGFPLYMKNYLQNKYNINIKDRNIYGVEIGDRQAKLAMINAMFSLDTFDNIIQGDSFVTNIKEYLDLSIHNVPFGKRISYKNTLEHYNHVKTDKMPEFKNIIPIDIGKCDAPIASQMVIYKTKHLGLCIIKDGQETTGIGKFIKYRKYFCDSCNIKKILKIPGGIFSSTGTKTICIYFVKGEQTKDIQFLELNDKCDIITELVKVSYNDLKHNNFSWDPNTYMIDEEFAKLVSKSKCEFKKLGDVCEFMPKSKRKAGYGQDNGKYNFYTSSYKVQKCNEYDYEDECIIIGDGGKANIKIDNKFSCSDHNIIIKTPMNKYIYYFLLNNMYLLENGFKGAGLKNISKEYLQNIQIPIPTLEKQQKCVEQLDLLNKRKQRLEEDNVMINQQMKFYFENQIQKNLDNIEIKKLSKVCDIHSGTYITKEMKIEGKYPVYGGGNPSFYINQYNYKDEIIIAKDGVSLDCVRYEKNKFFLNHHGWVIHNKHNIISKRNLYYTLLFNQNRIYGLAKGSGQKGINQINFNNLQIYILSQNKQNEITQYLDILEKNKQNNSIQIKQLNELIRSILEQSYL